VKLESLGIAAVPVATHEFMTAARAQAAALGRADLDAVYVQHPIQDQTPQEIAAKAEAVIGEIVARLTISTASGSERAPS
jgi:alkanesulfonate monooxygenase SsuD/methylene tetrahydromethanopterin reductase-like flavin-dependent oxidoreductase (luciferase family)